MIKMICHLKVPYFIIITNTYELVFFFKHYGWSYIML